MFLNPTNSVYIAYSSMSLEAFNTMWQYKAQLSLREETRQNASFLLYSWCFLLLEDFCSMYKCVIAVVLIYSWLILKANKPCLNLF